MSILYSPLFNASGGIFNSIVRSFCSITDRSMKRFYNHYQRPNCSCPRRSVCIGQYDSILLLEGQFLSATLIMRYIDILFLKLSYLDSLRALARATGKASMAKVSLSMLLVMAFMSFCISIPVSTNFPNCSH
jgi:hypothetical protein